MQTTHTRLVMPVGLCLLQSALCIALLAFVYGDIPLKCCVYMYTAQMQFIQVPLR